METWRGGRVWSMSRPARFYADQPSGRLILTMTWRTTCRITAAVPMPAGVTDATARHAKGRGEPTAGVHCKSSFGSTSAVGFSRCEQSIGGIKLGRRSTLSSAFHQSSSHLKQLAAAHRGPSKSIAQPNAMSAAMISHRQRGGVISAPPFPGCRGSRMKGVVT